MCTFVCGTDARAELRVHSNMMIEICVSAKCYDLLTCAQLFAGRMLALSSEFFSGGEEAVMAYVNRRSAVSALAQLI